MHQVMIAHELAKAQVRMPQNGIGIGIGIGWAGLTILEAGTRAQMERYLPPLLAAEEIWCQLFSEPDSGSDLASLSTRAVRDGDEYIVNGSKIWSSGAHHSEYGILIARPTPTVPSTRASRTSYARWICRESPWLPSST
jgi:alkylation response protein AidB-like acyl-CoA dehydrogenase